MLPGVENLDPFAATTMSQAATSWHPAAAASWPAETPATTGIGSLVKNRFFRRFCIDSQRRAHISSPENVVHEVVAGVEDPHVMLDAVLGGELLQVVTGGEDGPGGAQHHAAGGVIRRGLSG